MTAKLTLAYRPGTVTVHDEGVVRAVAGAVAYYDRTGVDLDTTFRVGRPSPSGHTRRAVVFHASAVEALNAVGADLGGLNTPAASTLAVAA